MKTYAVRRGDFLPKICLNLGVDPADVWDHPKNADLRELRGDWHILCEGDVLTIPEPADTSQPLAGGSANSYVADIPAIETHLLFTDDSGPYANEAYTVDGLGDPVEGTTDNQGKITVSPPVTVSTIRVVFPARKKEVNLFLGDMEPLTELTGVQMRLAHLGFLHTPPSGELDDATVEALRAFQAGQSLDESGAVDDATVAALKVAFGC